MSIGYACLAIGVPGSGMKNCLLKNATEENLMSLIGQNLEALNVLIDYNVRQGIRLFRISSDLIPFGSSVAMNLPWPIVYGDILRRIGEKIALSGMRVSMHPGQYTVINSPDPDVARRAAADLEYHASVLDALGVGVDHKIILHAGGVYGDKVSAKQRFLERFHNLAPGVRCRLVLENDDKLFHVEDILELSVSADLPVVFDNLHHAVNPPEKLASETEWIDRCAQSWKQEDGRQKLHYSQSAPDKRPGAHSATISIAPFLRFFHDLDGRDVDIMLEVKDKNVSALKCIHCVEERGIGVLEADWGRYKYAVLERAPDIYLGIRRLLKDKRSYPALEMYRLLEDALAKTPAAGNAINAAEHVWGYVRDKATAAEKSRFRKRLQAYAAGDVLLTSVKKNLLTLSEKYGQDYLLSGYYFDF